MIGVAVLLLAQPQMTVFTSTRYVCALQPCQEGLAVATRGGALLIPREGTPTKLTVLTGLPSNEVTAIRADGTLNLVTPLGEHKLNWRPILSKSKDWDFEFGIGLKRRGQPVQPPPPSKQITCVAVSGGTPIIGTADQGAWKLEKGKWQALSDHRTEPAGHNIQHLSSTRNQVSASTLDNGLALYDGQTWSAPQLSSVSPKQSLWTPSALLVRHGSGRIDELTQRGIRKLNADFASCMAALGSEVWVGITGGWKEMPSTVHRPQALAGVSITCLLPLAPNLLLIGTQGHGLALADRKSGDVRWLDQGSNLGDDWVTALHQIGDKALVGTFAAGALWLEGDKLTPIVGLQGSCITSAATSGDRTWIGTRSGLFELRANHPALKVEARVGTEVQALTIQKDALWIGTRTGLYRLRIS